MVNKKQNSNLRAKHNAQVQKIFDNFLDKRTPIFVKVDQFHYSNLNYEIPESAELTVLTEMMYEYDKETILNPNQALSVRNYRPYFASIIIPIDSNKTFAFLRGLEQRWFPAMFQSGDNSFQTSILLSASPIQIHQRTIIIKKDGYYYKGKEINDLIKQDYDPSQMNGCMAEDDLISAELNSKWGDNSYRYIDIYNLGHGNADYIIGNKKRILYDIGYPYRHFPNNLDPMFPKTMNSFGLLKPHLVIISHWDTDHYMGCAYASDHIFNVNWIAPTLTSNNDNTFTLNSFRLVAFLKSINKLKLVDRAKSGTFKAGANNLVIRMGDGKPNGNSNITTRNREGLYLELVEKNGRTSILAGDVPYNNMDSSIFKNKLNFLHVPHHCSKMNLNILSNSINGCHAIISTDTKQKIGPWPDVDIKHEAILKTNFNNNIHYTIGNNFINKYKIRALRLNPNGTICQRT